LAPETSEHASPPWRGRIWPSALLLAAAAGVCYANSFAVPFLFDDPLPGAALDYTTRPLVWATFALNRALSGSSVWSYHAFNLLVHLANGLLLLGVLRRTLERAAPGLAERTRSGLALVIALLWLCHPLQTGAVTYLSQRAESLGAFFVLACLYAFIRSTTAARPRGWELLSLASLALGFATKETIAVAPLLVWLYDALFVAPGAAQALAARRRYYKQLVGVTVASFVLFIVPLLLTGGATVGFAMKEHGALAYARTQPAVVLHYLGLVFWPHPLVFDYGWPVARSAGEYVPQLLVVIALLCAALVCLRRRPAIGFAAAWFFVCLAPSSSIVPIKDLAFEHRVYLPLAGVLALVVVGGWWAVGRTLPGAPFLREGLALAALLALGTTTFLRNREYLSATELWRSVVARAPRNPRGHGNLAHELIGEGKLDEAVAALQAALALDPHYHGALHRLGNVHRLRGEWDLAVDAYLKAIDEADLPAYRYGLACAFLGKGAFPEAETCYRKALELEPNKPENHLGLANALVQLDRPADAELEFELALRLDPTLQEAHTNLAVLLLSQGKASEALEHNQKALAIPPNSAQEQFNLGQCLVALGRTDEALQNLRAVSRLAPGMPEPQAAVAKALLSKQGASAEEKAEALQLATKANETTASRRADILETLAMAQAANGDPAAAVALVEKALELPGPKRNATFRERLQAQLQQYRSVAGQ
jgi:tetratricopeptide (TPR) repeat protein